MVVSNNPTNFFTLLRYFAHRRRNSLATSVLSQFPARGLKPCTRKPTNVGSHGISGNNPARTLDEQLELIKAEANCVLTIQQSIVVNFEHLDGVGGSPVRLPSLDYRLNRFWKQTLEWQLSVRQHPEESYAAG
jgi:hypothetical protein